MTDAESQTDALSLLDGQVRECFGRVVYTHKTHEKDADIAIERFDALKTWQIVLSAITTGGLLIAVLGPADKSKLTGGITALISTVLLVLNSYMKDKDLGLIAQRHKEAADKLWDVRESYLSLLTDSAGGTVSIGDIRSKRDELQARVVAINETAPRTTAKAYLRAQKALKIDEDFTFSPTEIDAFLPSALRTKTRLLAPK